jgi:hypothetical protein
MGRFFLGAIGMIFSFLLIKYRERVGDAIGDPDWANKLGGIYNVLIICGTLGFFWSISYITNTQDILFAPLFWIFPQKAAPGGVPGSEFAF